MGPPAPSGPIDSEAALAAAVGLLRARDPEVVGRILAFADAPRLRRREPGFEGLVSIVLGQQVSVASATAIAGRLRAAFAPLSPAAISAADDAVLRGCGLSGAKIRTVRAIAAAVLSGGLAIERLAELPAEEAHRRLVAVKGIGPWTADVFLLFCLGHPDAWPAGDLALQEAARLALDLEARPTTALLTEIGERWRPHRGAAAYLLWAYYRAAKKGREGIPLALSPNDSTGAA